MVGLQIDGWTLGHCEVSSLDKKNCVLPSGRQWQEPFRTITVSLCGSFIGSFETAVQSLLMNCAMSKMENVFRTVPKTLPMTQGEVQSYIAPAGVPHFFSEACILFSHRILHLTGKPVSSHMEDPVFRKLLTQCNIHPDSSHSSLTCFWWGKVTGNDKVMCKVPGYLTILFPHILPPEHDLCTSSQERQDWS